MMSLTQYAAQQVLAAYEQRVRANMSPEWDTIAAVARCQDGVYGAWGEIMDTAHDLDIDWDTLTGPEYDAIHDAFTALQARLLVESADHVHVFPETYRGQCRTCGVSEEP